MSVLSVHTEQLSLLLMAPLTPCCLLQVGQSSPQQLEVFAWFSQRVAARCPEKCITHETLLRMLSVDR